MNLLDENNSDDQRHLLRSWRIAVRQIGQDVGRKALTDDDIIPLLHQLNRPTFFTRDDGFDHRALCHAAYCLVHLAIGESEAASVIRRFLRHPAFASFAQRRGAVPRVSHTGIHVRRLRTPSEEVVAWPQ